MKPITLNDFQSYLAKRPRNIHKGDCGHVLAIGGDYGYFGAIRLTAEAALRVGAGLVSVVTRKENIIALRSELMGHEASALRSLLKKATVIVIGPGLSQSAWGKSLLKIILKQNQPLVVDADALNLLAKKPVKNNNWIITPHPGEAARLLKISKDAVEANRMKAAVSLQNKYQAIAVLKGAGTLVATDSESPVICEAGNPGMATAGMGDVLSGVIAGLIAQGIPLPIAAKLGVSLHAEAGDLAAKNGERGMIASDLFLELRKLVNPHDV